MDSFFLENMVNYSFKFSRFIYLVSCRYHQINCIVKFLIPAPFLRAFYVKARKIASAELSQLISSIVSWIFSGGMRVSAK